MTRDSGSFWPASVSLNELKVSFDFRVSGNNPGNRITGARFFLSDRETPTKHSRTSSALRLSALKGAGTIGDGCCDLRSAAVSESKSVVTFPPVPKLVSKVPSELYRARAKPGRLSAAKVQRSIHALHLNSDS